MQEDAPQKNAAVFLKPGVFFVFLIVLDQLAKHFAEHIFFNDRFAFSLPVPEPLMYIIYFLVTAGIIYYIAGHYKNFPPSSAAAWVLILAGALSNIGERILLGRVRDFIYISFYRWTGVYNLADGYIIVGITILLMARNNDKNNKN